MILGVTGFDDVAPIALLCGAGLLVAVQAIQAIRQHRTPELAPKAHRPMHFVFLTARQDPQAYASVDRLRQAMLLEDALRGALDSAAIEAAISVKFNPSELTARIETADATLAFNTVAPVFLASSYCAAGYVLLRHGPPGAQERQIKLSDMPGSTRPGMTEHAPVLDQT